MFKESVICIIIVVVIFSLDVFTQDYTNKTTLEITKIFSDLKEQILKEDKEQITKQIASLEESWKGRHNKLAYYIEHDEIEKVDKSIVEINEYIKLGLYDEAIPEIRKCSFILEHIKNKFRLEIKNVF